MERKSICKMVIVFFALFAVLAGPVAVSALPARVFEAVASFSAYGQEDDVTLLVLRGRSRVAVAA